MCFHWRSVLFSMAGMLAAALAPAGEPPAVDQAVQLSGQVVCSECWFEADRSKVAYGTASDLECAARCAKKGIPAALAVPRGDAHDLYLLEPGTLRFSREEWLGRTGAHVRLSGRVSRQGERSILHVDALEPVEAPAASPAGDDFPTLELEDLARHPQTIASYRGRLVVLNFWATWCAPCRKEMPALVGIQNDYGAFGVQVVAASADPAESHEHVARFAREHRMGFPVLLGATTEQMAAFGVGPALPATVILDRSGRVVERFRGAVRREEVARALDRLLQRAGNEPAGGVAHTHSASLVPS